MTNFEKIKGMTEEQYNQWQRSRRGCLYCAYNMKDCAGINCADGHEKWLQQEAEEDAE